MTKNKLIIIEKESELEELESIEKLTDNINSIVSNISNAANEITDLLDDYEYNYGYNSIHNFMEVKI